MKDTENIHNSLENRLKTTQLFKQGGSCWECCEYEDMCENMQKFIAQELTSQHNTSYQEGFTKGSELSPNSRISYQNGYSDAEKLTHNTTVQECMKIVKELHKDHTKEVGTIRENPTHEKDEYWCCCECLDDQFQNKALSDVEQSLRELLK